MTIKRHANLHKLIDREGNIKIEKGGMDLKSKDYCLLSGDLRDWSAVSQRLIESGLDLGYIYIYALKVSSSRFIYIIYAVLQRFLYLNVCLSTWTLKIQTTFSDGLQII